MSVSPRQVFARHVSIDKDMHFNREEKRTKTTKRKKSEAGRNVISLFSFGGPLLNSFQVFSFFLHLDRSMEARSGWTCGTNQVATTIACFSLDPRSKNKRILHRETAFPNGGKKGRNEPYGREERQGRNTIVPSLFDSPQYIPFLSKIGYFYSSRRRMSIVTVSAPSWIK
mmetsp:Transcript_8754/g.10280  ORF Transcript_8754/g.10280 Transcript_8754/m.10280 type:complete len:170 (-) Transcript_8754:167-676(-)